MKKSITLVIALVLSTLAVIAQENAPITIKRKFAFQNDKKLSAKELKTILMNTPESAVECKKANSQATLAMVPMIAGTGLCLYGAAVSLKQSADENKAISNGNLYYKSDQSKFVLPVLAGACLVIAGIPLILSSQKHTLKSIELYNEKLKGKTGYRNDQKLDIGITQNGVGVVFHF